MGGPAIILLLIIACLVAIPVGILAIVYIVVPAFKGLAWLVVHLCKFIGGEIGDVLRVVGALVTMVVLIPLTILNVLIGRWSASAHFGRAIQSEIVAVGRSLYRVVIGHPARLLCLTPLTEGIEKRIPEVVAAAPGSDRPSRRQGQFDGYTIIGSLPGGGSGGRLYIGEPSPEKIAAFARQGQKSVGRVVIKTFSLADGSTLPQIVRENRALPAAKRLGLILEHELTDERYYYVTRYVPGEALGIITQRLHAGNGSAGLGKREISTICGYATDLLRTLTTYHDGGLWHKDVKPDNIIIADGRAHLVDFGLVTPLRSSMTLTTHGTEYFRDPEMVRMALRGVKVHEVDGAKFDIYATGAVLYSMIENSFPAHGGLSQISCPCPEAIRWIVRRAMTDYERRYESAALMLEDIETVLRADDPYAVKPIALPSMRAGGAAHMAAEHGWEGVPGPGSPKGAPAGVGAAAPGDAPDFGRKPGRVESVLGQMGGYVDAAIGAGGRGAAIGAASAAASVAANGGKPRIRVTGWWSGKYEILPPEDGVAGAGRPVAAGSPVPPPAVFHAPSPRNPGSTAAEQLVRARARAREARDRAKARMDARRAGPNVGMNLGVGLAVLVFLGACGLFTVGMFLVGSQRAAASSAPALTTQNRSVEIGLSGIKVSVSRTGAAPATGPRALPPMPPQPGTTPVSGTAATPVQGARVVVIRDPIAFQKPYAEPVDESLARLRERGFTLVGAAAEGSEARAAEDEIVADLRNTIGVMPFETPETEAAIRGWLNSNADAQVVLWLGRHEGDKPTAWLVAGEGLDTATVDAALSTVAGEAPKAAKPAPRQVSRRDRARR